MYSSEYKVRIRYADTDQMGFVYYGNYPIFYEIGRVEAMRSLGFSYKKLEDNGIMMPVLESRSKYILPAKYDELITIKTTITSLPKVKIHFNYEIFNETNKLIHIGETTLAFIRKDSMRPCRVPSEIIDLLNPFYNA
ncbi:acyl-CoA thioesterase [Chondrinema litorale]|uniref:acyl-CoA thioesterase n=1 Tax=Chondrinema litorale TaxID=2994555 RepID=UPI00254385A8|nr:thioesterase family protein [Chondrinema litorale]UZR92259.1 thioesterase family protein [Chondrinema litorale]